jgi:hypothetical protein
MVLYTNSFGYSGLLIAKGGEKKLGWLAFGALITNILISLVLIKFVVISFENVIFATMATYFVYVFFLGKLGRIKLHINSSIKMVLNDIFPIRLLIPYFLSLSLIYIGSSAYYFILPLLFFVILNFKLINNIKLSVNEVISNPDFINI